MRRSLSLLQSSSPMISHKQLERIEQLVRELYDNIVSHEVTFHGWPHICFVRKKAVELAARNGADVSIVSAAALVHDLNYIAERNSEPDEGRTLRRGVLAEVGVSDVTTAMIEELVETAHTRNRGPRLSPEAEALSDADTLFKTLPITPVALSYLFRHETGMSLATMAEKIVHEQRPLVANGIYFYDRDVERDYGRWARANIALWSYVSECLQDPDVVELLRGLGIE
jgi:uncharacterized protein